MKYHMALKFIAFVLCGCCLFLAVGAALSVLSVADAGLYSSSVEEILQQRMESNLRTFADSLAKRYAARNLSNCPELLIAQHVYDYYPPLLTQNEQLWFYTIKNQRGQALESRVLQSALDDALKLEFLVSPNYPVVLDYEVIDNRPGVDQDEKRQEEDFIPGETLPAPENAEYKYIETVSYQDDEGVTHNYRLGVCEGPVYLVTLYILPGAYARESHWSWDLARTGHQLRFDLLWILGAALLMTAALVVYLCCCAGRSSHSDQVRPAGLNRMPLDIYFLLVAAALAAIVWGGTALLDWFLGHFDPMWMVFLAVSAMGLAGSMLVVGLIFALAAQVKCGDGRWLRNTAAAGLLRGVRRLLPALKKVFTAVATVVYRAAKAVVTGVKNFFRLLWRGIRRAGQLLPLAWQWLLAAAIILAVLWLTLDRGVRGMVTGVGIFLVMVLYGAYCFGTLLESTKRMSKGDLDTKVDDRLMVGAFRDYAEHLNALADVAVDAARKQMKSERMKAELITNISHDIKTPLTSIINYVDLMQKVGSPEEAQAYLEVLGRQSQRLKKLIEDLMEMSKASTGNMHVELTQVDAVETVNQALGEFYEKLENAGLIPVVSCSAQQVMMVADGRLAWRVLSNLLSNAVKYAMPGTRLYIDVTENHSQVQISLKNISREALNISADELMERFVRGDASRNTEGSGLGLNIARSLMELQKGRLLLQVDGDLFKATVCFNSAPRRDR